LLLWLVDSRRAVCQSRPQRLGKSSDVGGPTSVQPQLLGYGEKHGRGNRGKGCRPIAMIRGNRNICLRWKNSTIETKSGKRSSRLASGGPVKRAAIGEQGVHDDREKEGKL